LIRAFWQFAVASFSAYTLLRDVCLFYFVLCLFVCIVLPVEVNKVVQTESKHRYINMIVIRTVTITTTIIY